MKIQLQKSSQSETLIVAFSTSKKKGNESITEIHHAGLQKHLAASLKDQGISGKAQESTLFREQNVMGHRHVAFVGVGASLQAEDFRRAAASIQQVASQLKVQSVAISLESAALSNKKNLTQAIQGLAEGLILSDYNFDELKSKKKGDEKKEISVNLVTKSAADASLKKIFQESLILAETVNFSRRLGDLPGNLMTPTLLANAAVEAAKGTGIKVTVWDKARIKKEKMGGLLGVSMGSSEEPRFIIMEYKGAAASKKPVAFVGKGLTFDCGGISIKPSAGMEEMKYDMCGGANVIGTLLAIAKLKLKINAVGLVASTENLAGPSATKPGDVHTARNGKTFEVNNTDAEGRLILADALSYASELKPQIIVDAATLTGAMVVALGNLHTGFFTRDDRFAKKIEAAADQTAESVWRMPLVDEHVKDMRGTFADFSNISSSKGAGSATAAAFLEQFVAEGTTWAHFDIAGTGWAVGNRLPYCSRKGASGVMIRTFVTLAKSYV